MYIVSFFLLAFFFFLLMYEYHRNVFFVSDKRRSKWASLLSPLVKGGAVCGPHHGLRGVHLGGLGPRRPPRSYPVPGKLC